VKEFCFGKLPAIFRTVRRIYTVRLVLSLTKSLEKIPLFLYQIRGKKGTSMHAPNVIRAKRESKAIDDKAAVEAHNPGHSGNDSVSRSPERNRFTRLPVIMPALFTVLLFVACVAFITFKMYNADDFPFDRSIVDLREDEVTSCCPKRSRQKTQQNELYDVMLKEYKAEKHRTNPSRKSSTIRIEGIAGKDPQTIAKKHLLLNNLRDPGSGNGAVGTLIKLSSTAFIASSMARDDSSPLQQPIEEEPETKMEDEKEKVPGEVGETSTYVNGTLPEATSSTSENQEEKDIPKGELASYQSKQNDGKSEEDESNSALPSPDSVAKDKRSSGSVWFKYKRLEKQKLVTNDSDEELDYDCAQHIHRILSASRENIDEARRILPDDVKDIVLPQDLETALAEFEMWPDSSV